VTDRALEGIESEAGEPAYEVWRRRVQQEFAATQQRETIQKVQHENG
jgi:hypothetical protein